MVKANDKQVAGSHYKSAIEPWDAITAWELGYLDGSAVKYLARWRKKNGIEDIMKAIHFLEKLVEVENGRLQRLQAQDATARQGDAQTPSEARLRKCIGQSPAGDGRAETNHQLDQGLYRPTSLSDII
jgi:hypothetical protein